MKITAKQLFTKFPGCAVTYAVSLLAGCSVEGNLNIDNAIVILRHSTITGKLSQSAGTFASSFLGVSLSGVPTIGVTAPAAGAWTVGDRHENISPAGSRVGQTKAWACTVAGSPGTWVSEGNL